MTIEEEQANEIKRLETDRNRLRAENESLKKENWEHIARGYTLINMLPDETLVGDIQTARRNIGGVVDSLRAENEKLREAFEKAANDMRPMLRSMISRNEAEEIVRRAARTALEGVTRKSGAGNE